MRWKDRFSMKEYLIQIGEFEDYKKWRQKCRHDEYYRKVSSICYLPKKVLQFTKLWEFLMEYESAKEASKKTGILEAWIRLNINWKIKSSGNFVWKYK
jgi:hypothetical protein